MKLKTVFSFLFIACGWFSGEAGAITFSGKLVDKSNVPVSTTINLYQPGSNDIVAYGKTDGYGFYSIGNVQTGAKDIEYKIDDFFINDFSIKLLFYNISSDITDPINYVTQYPSDGRLLFSVDVPGSQIIQTRSPVKPQTVKIDTILLTEVNTLDELLPNTWFYDAAIKILYLRSSSLKIGIYTDSWNFHEDTAETIAKTFDMSQSYWIEPTDTFNQYDVKMDQVHALNPKYKFLVYRNGTSVPNNYWIEDWNYAKDQGWLLKDINDNYVTEGPWPNLYAVNITTPSYQKWFADKISGWIKEHPAYDGVMLDNSMKYNAGVYDYLFNNRPINPKTGTYFTDNEVRDGCAAMINAVIDAIGTDKLVLPNGINNGTGWWNNPAADGYRYILSKVQRLNVIGSEGTFRNYNDQWYSESNWKASVDFIVWVQDNFLKDHPEKYFSAGCVVAPLPAGSTPEQVIAYGFCSMMLAAKYSSPQNTIDFMLQDHPDREALLPLVQELRNIDMIAALGDYYKIDSTSVYARDFVRGKVLVNPSDSPYSVFFEGTFSTVDGETVSASATMAPHTGLMLIK
jgi:hypothetical protein